MHEFLNYHRHRHRHRRREEEEEEERNKKRTTTIDKTTGATDGGNVNSGNGNDNENDDDDDDDDHSNDDGDGTTHPASSSSSYAANGDDGAVDVSSLLPRHLAHLVRHHHGEFYVSRSFDPSLIANLMAQGFLPIATLGHLLPKLHAARCVVRLAPRRSHPPEEDGDDDNSKEGGGRCGLLHVSRSARRRSGKFDIGLNERFDEVVAGCHRQHGENWLYPPIVSSFRSIHARTRATGSPGMPAEIAAVESDGGGKGAGGVRVPVRLYSVEVYDAYSGVLAGGELGYSVGGVYSSLTGFSEMDGAGSVQLGALGNLLAECGFEYWDLGMDLEYKRRLGAELVGRDDFLRIVRRSRVRDVVLRCCGQAGGGSRVNARELLDRRGERGGKGGTDNGGGR